MGILGFLLEAIRGDAAEEERRRVCPLCHHRKFDHLDRHSWNALKADGETVNGTTTVLRCLNCKATLFEEAGTGPMTAEQRGNWLRKVAPPA